MAVRTTPYFLLGMATALAASYSLMPLAFSADDAGAMSAEVPYKDMTLEELMEVPVSVASLNLTPTLAAPGIITVITEEEIRASGARDLIDLFNRVPGFQVAYDTVGLVSLGIRGIWANESKVQLRWDDHILNEGAFGSIYLGNRYPVDQIKKIEIIRGPGSAIYGGNASLAVINIISKNAVDLGGASILGEYGQMTRSYARRNLSLGYGKELGDWRIKASTFIGSAQRTDQDINAYVYPGPPPPDTAPYTSLAGKTALQPFFSTLDITYKGFDLNLIADLYQGDFVGGYKQILLDQQDPYKNRGYYGKLSYDFSPTTTFHIATSLNIKRTETANDEKSELLKSELGVAATEDLHNYQFKETATASYDWTDALNVLFGFDIFQNKTADTSGTAFAGPPFERWDNSSAIFGQLSYRHSIANLTLGARYERSSISEPALVPRIALGKAVGRFNFKALFADAYRSPTMTNIQANVNPDGILKPERLRTYELQASVLPDSHSFFSVNLYKIDARDLIIYDAILKGNVNRAKVSVVGVELEHKYKHDWGYLNANYSYYRAVSQSDYSNGVPQDPHAFLGLAQHIFSTTASVKLLKDLYLGPTARYVGPTYGQFFEPGNTETPSVAKYSPVWLFDLILRRENLFVDGLELGFGVYNLTNQTFYLHQAFYGLISALPGPSRELLLRADYTFRM